MNDIDLWYTDKTQTVRKETLRLLDWARENIEADRAMKTPVSPVQIMVIGQAGRKELRKLMESKAYRDEIIKWLDEQ